MADGNQVIDLADARTALEQVSYSQNILSVWWSLCNRSWTSLWPLSGQIEVSTLC